MARVRVVQRPAGEAPEWVRDAWIGLELPLKQVDPVSTWGFGVLTGPRNIVLDVILGLLGRAKRVEGYLVPADEAVEILAETQRDAALWWRENAAYHVRRGALFIFDSPACERVG